NIITWQRKSPNLIHPMTTLSLPFSATFSSHSFLFSSKEKNLRFRFKLQASTQQLSPNPDPPSPSSNPKTGVIIVGAGLAGLAAATKLNSENIPFLLIEASDAVGGRVRTDVVDGFLLDRGFQIFITAYPEAQKLLDYQALDLQKFYSGARIYLDGQFHTVADPLRHFVDSVKSLANPIGSVLDKLLIGSTRIRVLTKSDDEIISADEVPTIDLLRKIGFSNEILARFFRPFFGGIFFDTELETSSRLFDFIFKCLALGDNTLPAKGIGAIPNQLAAKLPPSSILFNRRVISIGFNEKNTATTVTLQDGEVLQSELGVILAVEEPEINKILAGGSSDINNARPVQGKPARSTVCLYFSAEKDQIPVQDPVLFLNGSGKGIVNNMFFATNVAPSYGPPGKALVSVSLIGLFEDVADDDLTAEVVRELSGWFGSSTVGSWRHLRTYRIGFAQPNQSPPTDLMKDPRVGPGLYLCGDHLTSATFDGALVSGRKAVEALLSDRALVKVVFFYGYETTALSVIQKSAPKLLDKETQTDRIHITVTSLHFAWFCIIIPKMEGRKATMQEQWSLYEAYNELHGLAQELKTPFDAPAVLVVGHQTDGKSALVEALMGFQFNHVGGGTKTRRPITLHMKYDPQCEDPACHLVSDEDPTYAHPKSLHEIQAYIESENMRLEKESSCQFSAKEIIIRVEYKYCPNLTIIDTPGLVAPAPGRKNQALQSQARAVEALVRAKMQHKEFIILCLEDCSDWSNATTRRVVMQVDPELSRTVIVSTKLDTKIPQFARSSDVEVFLSPPAHTLDGFILGESPFFTSVPSGRVGSGHESVFRSNDEFKQAISLREMEDIASLTEKLGRSLSVQERNRIGVSKLRSFLEELLQKRYMDNVPLIIPLLEKEYRSATRKLNEINKELSTLDEAKLKQKGREFHDLFLTKGKHCKMRGLMGEHLLVAMNAGMRLYGGAQYHRAMAEFRFVAGGIKCPQITREEIVNACGVEDIHDGTNYSRTACVIAVAKARDTFEPFLHQKDGEYLSGHDVFLRRVASAFNKCMEDLESTTRYVTWSLHNKNRAGLRQFLDSFGGTEQSATGNAGMSQDSSVGSASNEKHDSKSRMDVKLSHLASGIDSGSSIQTTDTKLADLLDNTLWNRRLAPSSERIVYALVQQIFHGIKEYFLASVELKFNCFLLMPVVDKLPALLRLDLESAFEDDLDNVFDITNLRHSFGQRKRDTEIDLKRIKRLKEKFRLINEQLNSHQLKAMDIRGL
ncbi:hypothetical protein Tsubulata_035499, partial [Turnera subulata]